MSVRRRGTRIPGRDLVTRDGQTRLVLVHKDLIGDAQPGYDPDCRGASHEQPGRLPRYWANRIAALQEWHAILGEAGQMLAAENRHRCGRPTKTGAAAGQPSHDPASGARGTGTRERTYRNDRHHTPSPGTRRPTCPGRGRWRRHHRVPRRAVRDRRGRHDHRGGSDRAAGPSNSPRPATRPARRNDG